MTMHRILPGQCHAMIIAMPGPMLTEQHAAAFTALRCTKIKRNHSDLDYFEMLVDLVLKVLNIKVLN